MRWTRNGTASSAKGRESSLCPRLMWLALWPLRTLRPKRYVLKSMLKCHLANQALTHRGKSTSQICRQASWSHCSPKRLRYTPIFHCSILHSSPRAQQAQGASHHRPPKMATQKHQYNRFQSQQPQYCATPRIQTMISMAQTSIHHITRGLGKG